MTFTIAGRCRRTGEAGLASATVSLAVGGLCPWFTSSGDIIASQAYASKRNGVRMYQAMEQGRSAAEAMALPQAEDEHIAYRQLLILPRQGEPVAFSGERCRPWSGHLLEDDCIVAGNVLAGAGVIGAMQEAFHAAAAHGLGERLLRALEAGRDAGGQAMPGGAALTERSASLCVLGGGGDAAVRLLDLRVDMHGSAVHEMRRLFEIYDTYGPYSDLRDTDPARTPPMAAFEAEALRRGGAFATRPSCFR
jgi:uncharacterized Ntn-hydrolase superfamily protein